MQKIQTTLLSILIIFAAIGTEKLIMHVGNFNAGKIKTEVTASSDTAIIAPATADTAAVQTAQEQNVQTPPPVSEPIPVITPLAPSETVLSIAAETPTNIEQNIASATTETKDVITTTEIKKETEAETKTEHELTVKEKRDARLSAAKDKEKEKEQKESEDNKKENASASTETKDVIATTEIKKKTETEAETKTEHEQISAPDIATTPTPTNVYTPIFTSESITKEMRNQPKVNKKILDTLQALRVVPDILTQLGLITDNAEKENKDKNKPKNLLQIFTDLIKELTSNIQENTIALEKTLDAIYKLQGNEASQNRCIQSTYFAYSDAENACVMISRKICKTKDIIPDNRYETIESCKQDHGLIEKLNESRETSAFKQQKEEYLGRLKTLQTAYKYYSVRWEELVDIANDSTDFDTLGQAGNNINLYRMEQQEPEKQETSAQLNAAKTTSTPDNIQLQPLSAASID